MERCDWTDRDLLFMCPKWKSLLLCACWLLVSDAAWAQDIQLNFRDVGLREALVIFAAQEGVDIVFSESQVAGLRATCAYGGGDTEDAIACILRGTPLRAERVRRRQYVLAQVAQESVPAQTGTIGGFVTDAESGEALPGANVYLPDVRLGTITNEAGYFALSDLPRVDYAVRISFVGYASADTVMAANPGPAVQVQLLPAMIMEAEQTVEAARVKPFAVEPGLMRVPTAALERLPGTPGKGDLLNALRWLPGVNRAGSGAHGLVIRGNAPDQNLYLLDGAPVYHPWHAFNLVSTFQSETFKNVRLYRGSFPAEHGGRLSAVLDAEMKDGSREQIEGVAAADLFSARFFAEGPLSDRISMMVAVRRSYLDQLIGKTQPVSEGEVVDTMRTGYYFFDGSAKVSWRPSNRKRLSLSIYGGRDVLDLRLPFDISLDFISPDFQDWLRPSDLFFEVDSHWGNYVANARYQYLYSDHLFVTAALYSSSYIARESIYIQPVVSSSVTSRYDVRLQDNGLKLDVDHYPSLTHQLRAGFRAVRRSFGSSLDAVIKRTPRSTDAMDQEDNLTVFELVGYVQDTWQPMASLQVQPGLRVSALVGNSLVSLEPRLGVRFSVGTVILRGFAGVQTQYVHRIRDRYSFLYDLVSARWVPASGAEKPSRSFNASLGAATNMRPGITISLDAYWHKSSDILLPRDETRNKEGLEGPGIELGTLLGQYVRGQARTYGLECMIRTSYGPWQGWLSYSAGRSESRTPDLRDSAWRPARYDVPQFLEAVVLRDVGQFFFAVSSTWRSGYPITVPEARYAVGDILDDTPRRYLHRPYVNNGRLPPTFRLGIQAGYWFMLEGSRISVQAQIYNLTNRRNVIGRVYDPEGAGPVRADNLYGFPLIPLAAIQFSL